MKLKHILVLLIIAMVSLGGIMASALDLPKKRVKGQQYFYYKVKKGESLYGISKELAIPIEDIVRSNPAAADGVKKGDLLLFSVDEYGDQPQAPVETEVIAEEIPVDTTEVVKAKNPAIAVLLPFGLDKNEPSRLNKLALDFYKGMLIAADSLSDRPGLIEIVARDIDGKNAAALRELVSTDTAVANASVIIGPEDDSSLTAIAEAAAANNTYVLNVLNIRDSAYIANPFMMQGNAPQRIMYKLAVDGLEADYPGYTPVILRSLSGKNDKESFTAYLTSRYRENGVEPIVIEYQSNLLMADLEVLPEVAGQKYVFIPSSGSLAEFNRFAYVLKSYRDRLRALASEAIDTSAENGEAPVYAMAEVFGYPDWTAFRGDALDTLHRLNATIYSRFFDDFNGFSTKNISADFRRWFGSAIIESIPTYGLLGYDSASYLIKNIRTNQGKFDPLFPASFSGIQSSFDFRNEGEGFVNNSIYIINYQSGGRISARVQ